MEIDEETKKRIRKMLLQKRKEFEGKLREAEAIFKRGIQAGEKNNIMNIEVVDCSDIARGNGKRVTLLRKCLKKFDHALKRLDQGDYGICQRCNCSIPLGRLEAVPFTEYCVPCKNSL